MSTTYLIVMIVGMALATLVSRVPPLVLATKLNPGPKAQRWLKQVPPAVMAALVAPAVFAPDGQIWLSYHNADLVIGALTLVVAIVTKNFYATIAFGVAAMAFVNLVLN